MAPRSGAAPPKRKPGASNKADPSDERVAVLVARQRGTRATLNTVLTGLDAANLTQALRPALSQDAVLSCDGNAAYGVAARELGIEAGYFVARYHGHGGDGGWHVQNVNAYHRRLKAWMARFPRGGHVSAQLSGLAATARPIPRCGYCATIPLSCATQSLRQRIRST